MQFWHTQLRIIRHLVCIRVSSLEEARKGASVSFINNRVGLLSSVDPVPL
jgi:hypothetical protein